MSQSETKRFFNDMAGNADLKAGADAAGNLQSIATYASGKGYDVTVDDLKEVASQNKDLSDEQLEAVAGGGIGVSIGCVVCISAS